MEKCVMCRQPGNRTNPINNHHIKGRRYTDKMRVHSMSCHVLAQWITNLYLLYGREDELSEKLIIYLYTRIVTLTHEGEFVLPIYR